uniref:CAP-Gly domain-containing protein n=1 Tax=Cebus imitator TaxID=2715852 RepID=A0A2K5RLR5_CEBIM
KYNLYELGNKEISNFRINLQYKRVLKLELLVGSPASCMELELYRVDDKFYSKLDQEDALLGPYPVDDGCRIHVIDHTGARLGEYKDVSLVEKYTVSQEAYDQRQDTVRSFLKRSKLGRYNEEERAQQEAEAAQRLAEEKAQASSSPVGSRCEVSQISSLATGLASAMMSHWGKTGSVNGKRYFECQAKYSAFVKPAVVTVGASQRRTTGWTRCDTPGIPLLQLLTRPLTAHPVCAHGPLLTPF